MKHFLKKAKKEVEKWQEIREKEDIQVMSETRKLCVLTAIDRNKASFTKSVGFGGLEKDDVILLQRHLIKDSVLITDGTRTYRNLNNVKLKSLKFGKAENNFQWSSQVLQKLVAKNYCSF